MAARVIIEFKDGTKKEFPDPKSGVVNYKGYRVVYENGVLRVMDPYDTWYNWPLDIVKQVTEIPMARF